MAIIEPLFEEKGRPDGRGRRGATRVRLSGKIDLTEGFIDASFTAAKKRALSSVLQSAAGNKIMAIVDRRSLPLAVHVACASPHEVRLDRDCKNFEATSLARPTADELFSVCDSGRTS